MLVSVERHPRWLDDEATGVLRDFRLLRFDLPSEILKLAFNVWESLLCS